MRHVRDAGEIDESIQAARREAVAAFGDGTLYVERLVEEPRHIEVQVFADDLGGIVHLFERDCSVQRRHQKVIEESPSPALTPRLRARITDAAVTATRAAQYRNAGTIEFLVDLNGKSGKVRRASAARHVPDPADEAPFYFLEMNTRLQVEHPVTEQVTGLDMVRAQLLVAAGEPLPWSQADVSQRGHAIEARIYAEDPARDFLPQAGRLLLYREPQLPGVRVDSGVTEGGEVSIYYDPMIAKVIATAETRDLALARLTAALRAFPVLGLRTNIPFLLRVLDHPRFRTGAVDTGFLDRDGATLAEATAAEIPGFVRAAALAHDQSPSAISKPQSAMESWDPWQR
jgi:acetyl/propionyl-CoA carboxylase alpha subunit